MKSSVVEKCKSLYIVFNMVDKVNEAIARFFSWLMLVLVLTISYEVLIRYIFGKPTLWSYDASYLLNSLAVVMGLAWVYKNKGHINVDILYNRYPRKIKLWMDVILTPFLFLIPWGYILYNMAFHVERSVRLKELATTGTLLPPIYPFKVWIFIGLILLFVQVLVVFLRNVLALIGGND